MPQPLRRLRRHLPMNGEQPFLLLNAAAPPAPSAPPPHEWEPLRRLRRHLPMNGEEPFLHLNAAAPPAPSAPPPHEWGAPPAPSAPPPHEWGGAFLYLLKGGEPGCPSLLVGRDFWVVAFHQGDLVETFQ